MTTCERTPYEEQKRRGEEIYEAQIRHLVGPEDEDKYVMVDVLTGDYEIHANPAIAGSKLRERRPDAVIHGIRRHVTYVGRMPSMHSLGKAKSAE